MKDIRNREKLRLKAEERKETNNETSRERQRKERQ
jgi:hypothetical protein